MKSLQSELAFSSAASSGALAPSITAARFRSLAQDHPLWQHPFVMRCREGRLTLGEVKVLASQMYKFCHEFPRFLASAMASCDDEAARQVIGANLWEELGEGDANRAHPALFRRFGRALGFSDAQLIDTPALRETRHLIDTYMMMSQRWGAAGILGALCYASEGIVSALYSQLQSGLRHAATLSDHDLEFFVLHVDIDDGHAEQLESVLMPMLHVPFQAIAIEHAIREAMDARCRFFDGVMTAAATFDVSASPWA